ncbi:transporter substrate-binding domain-containing protein [Roseovarius sp. EL26]|uniref:transporter substrate-binding domain-containing protein n=1 Tax=Roseovarius sp. EL26 TaxID=2126672 RepID=UPI000EA3EC73|nr:transporter substrate-binding domain-containing protein [Roseovarius sp. EL26]
MIRKLAIFLALLLWPMLSVAQELTVSTISRSPFSMEINDRDTGFSVDLWRAIAERIGVEFKFERHRSFTEMLKSVESGQVDLAIANISVTSEREAVMDFSQPIFSAGLQIMTPTQDNRNVSVWSIISSANLLVPVFIAFGVLVAAGMLMWLFERHKQPYFNYTAGKAVFPAFWWALNLVVNGGFEERVPRSAPGRFFGVILVISSLFVVSIFVARITSMMTIEAINSSVSSFSDLYGKRIGTVSRSTAATFMERRDLQYIGYEGSDELLEAFESGEIEAVVFDAPILAYYVKSKGAGKAQLAGPVFLRENYGIALPSGSPLAEEINKALLYLREDGTYAEIQQNWFGHSSD